MDKVYDLDFNQAMEIIMNGGSVKGNGFATGIFMRINKYGQLVIVDANRYYKETTDVFLTTIYHQKFRELAVMTIKELTD